MKKASLNFLCKLIEKKESASLPGEGSRFRVVLIQEGLGNLNDGYYYTKNALKGAADQGVFEGEKMYTDHPSSVEEKILPERSVNDIGGHYENVEYAESEDGTGSLLADLVLVDSPGFEKVRGLVKHATDFSQKYPDKDFVGLSINASGDSEPMDIDDFMNKFDIVPSAQGKVQKAKNEGMREVKVVNTIDQATSCDLVTAAGAKGMILELLEAQKMEKKKEKKHETEAEGEAEKKEAADGGDGKPAFGDKKAKPFGGKADGSKPAPKADGGTSAGAVDTKAQAESEDDSADGADGADADHADEDQDKALVAKMLKKFGLIPDDGADGGGDDGDGADGSDGEGEAEGESEAEKHEMESEAEAEAEHHETMKAAKHMMNAYKAAGHSPKEAAHRAAEAMKMAGHAHEAYQAECGKEKHEAEKQKMPVGMKQKKESIEVQKLRGENARLRESLSVISTEKYLDKKLRECGLPRAITKRFKETAIKFRNKEDVDTKLKLFLEGYRSTLSGEAELDMGEFVIGLEKTQSKAVGEVSFDDCID